MGANVHVLTSTSLPTVAPKVQIMSSTPTMRAAKPTTQNVPPQAKHPRGEGSLMNVRRMTAIGVVISVNTTPQMTRFRDAKVCNNWLQVRTDDHRIQSDYKYKSELQNPEGKKSILGIKSAW